MNVMGMGTKCTPTTRSKSLNKGGVMDHWSDRDAFFRNGCPFCQSQKFLEGPYGGLCTNFKCNSCGAKFNDTAVFGIDLLSGPKSNNLITQKEVTHE